ncbi:magnesium chelatase subunit D [Histidinibacterium lentulum]|uniref:magnesium chelatase subunit D n=1 Tax=Histidinibacterium lentulum TaxID=2480588 RepID=UPI001FECC4F8|nr:magnesium chelatase subunit D [Histidinibacterium lentulum]
MPDLASPAFRAALALDLLGVDPGLGGLVIRARQGPVRAALLERLDRLPLPRHRLHPQVTDEALYGGLDLAATLAAGRMVQEQGLLSEPSALVMAMAERCSSGLTARLAGCLDEGRGHVLIALDEGADAEEACPEALIDRVAFQVELSQVSPLALDFGEERDLDAARARLDAMPVTVDLHRQVTELAAAFGIASLRAPLFTLRAARALAALWECEADAEVVQAACALTLSHRATQVPGAPEEEPAEEPPPEPSEGSDGGAKDNEMLELPQELLIEAVQALLPPDLMARIRSRTLRGGHGSGAGAARKGNRRGRPLPSRPGRPGSGVRVDLVATLRTAAPWQRLRAQQAPGREGLHIRASDIRVKRFEDKSDRLLVFLVDASGSAALARLAEAKGAIELLLGEAYARRDHVSLVAFRGTGAEVLLPPTRSLVQTKRRLAELPGGGGTPLAAGLQAAMGEAMAARRRGMAPTICLLTDGRANIALDGSANRAQAAEDARRVGRAARLAGAEALVLDCGIRAEPGLKALAAAMDAPYLALPRADARRLSRAVGAALGD